MALLDNTDPEITTGRLDVQPEFVREADLPANLLERLDPDIEATVAAFAALPARHLFKETGHNAGEAGNVLRTAPSVHTVESAKVEDHPLQY